MAPLDLPRARQNAGGSIRFCSSRMSPGIVGRRCSRASGVISSSNVLAGQNVSTSSGMSSRLRERHEPRWGTRSGGNRGPRGSGRSDHLVQFRLVPDHAARRRRMSLARRARRSDLQHAEQLTWMLCGTSRSRPGTPFPLRRTRSARAWLRMAPVKAPPRGRRARTRGGFGQRAQFTGTNGAFRALTAAWIAAQDLLARPLSPSRSTFASVLATRAARPERPASPCSPPRSCRSGGAGRPALSRVSIFPLRTEVSAFRRPALQHWPTRVTSSSGEVLEDM